MDLNRSVTSIVSWPSSTLAFSDWSLGQYDCLRSELLGATRWTPLDQSQAQQTPLVQDQTQLSPTRQHTADTTGPGPTPAQSFTTTYSRHHWSRTKPSPVLHYNIQQTPLVQDQTQLSPSLQHTADTTGPGPTPAQSFTTTYSRHHWSRTKPSSVLHYNIQQTPLVQDQPQPSPSLQHTVDTTGPGPNPAQSFTTTYSRHHWSRTKPSSVLHYNIQ